MTKRTGKLSGTRKWRGQYKGKRFCPDLTSGRSLGWHLTRNEVAFFIFFSFRFFFFPISFLFVFLSPRRFFFCYLLLIPRVFFWRNIIILAMSGPEILTRKQKETLKWVSDEIDAKKMDDDFREYCIKVSNSSGNLELIKQELSNIEREAANPKRGITLRARLFVTLAVFYSRSAKFVFPSKNPFLNFLFIDIIQTWETEVNLACPGHYSEGNSVQDFRAFPSPPWQEVRWPDRPSYGPV